MRSYRRYIRVTASFIIIFIIGIVGLNVVVDPYGIWYIYRKAGFNIYHSKIETVERVGKAVRITLDPPKVLFVGTSRVKNSLDPGYYSKIKGVDAVYNAALGGANIYETRRFIEHAILNAPDLQEVYLGIDFFMFNAIKMDNNSFDDEQLSKKYITRKNFLLTAFSKKSITQSISDIKMNVDSRKSYDLLQKNGKANDQGLNDYFSKLTEDEFISSQVRPFMISRGPYTYKNYQISDEYLGELCKIVQLCKEKNISLKVFIMPIHAMQMEGIRASGSWTAYEEWKRKVIAIIPVIDFTVFNEITEEKYAAGRKYFWDTSHVTSVVGNLIIDRLLERNDSRDTNKFGVFITSENIETHLQNIREQRERWERGNLELVEKIAYFKGFLPEKPPCLVGREELMVDIATRIDTINGKGFQDRNATVSQKTPLLINGWAIVEPNSLKKVYIALRSAEGAQYYTAAERVKRPDIANLLQDENYLNVGFSINAPIEEVPKGKYEMKIIQVFEDERVYHLDNIGMLNIQ